MKRRLINKEKAIESFSGNKVKYGIGKLNAVMEPPDHVLEKLEKQIVGLVEKSPSKSLKRNTL